MKNDVKELKDQIAKKFESDTKEEVFDWGNGNSTVTVNNDDMPNIKDLKKAEVKESENIEVESGIIVEHKPEEKNSGINVGPLAPGSETLENVKKTEKELDDLIEVAKQRRLADGGKREPTVTTVEVLIDKLGMRTVEFTDEERTKMRIAKKIKVTQIDDKSLKSIKMNKPKAIRQKTLIEKAFSRQFAPFIAVASGYTGKMRNLSSVEIINLISIDEREDMDSAEKLSQKATLIYNKLEESSIGKFKSFDEFAKKTAEIDLPVFIYAITRATYPDKETLLMNCSNPDCTRRTRDENGKITNLPTQFNHEYSNNEILLVDRISDKLKDEAARIYDASFTVEDSKAACEEAILNKQFRFALGEDSEIIIDIYCPSIYEVINDYERKIADSPYLENDVYMGLITTARYIKAVHLKDDENEEYNSFDDPSMILEILTKMDQEVIEVVQQCISDNIFEYMYRYGFKASSVVCPVCGHAMTEDVVINIDRLLFLEARRHLINE